MFAKLAVAPWLFVAGIEAVKGGAESIILFASLIIALGYLFRLARRLGGFGRRVLRGMELLEGLPPWQRGVDSHLKNIDSQIAVIADADRHRVTDALAGDERSPVDRRRRRAAY